jgi:uncharacterized protein YkwD
MRKTNQTETLVLLGAAILALPFLSLLNPVNSAMLEPASTDPVYLPMLANQPTPETTPTIPPDDLEDEQTVATQINQQRHAAGLAPFTLDDALTQAARRHSRDMADNGFTSHTGSDGSSAGERVREAGYEGTYVGEIIGWGFGGDPATMIDWWMNSPPHRALILSSRATDYGVGYAHKPESQWKHYWTVDFGQRSAQGATSVAPRYVCTYTAQGADGGSRLTVHRTEPCPKD